RTAWLNRRCALRQKIASGESLAKPVLSASPTGIAAGKEGGGLDLVQRAVGENIATRLDHPVARIAGAGKPHRLGEGLIDVAGREALQRAIVTRVGIHCRPVGPPDFD